MNKTNMKKNNSYGSFLAAFVFGGGETEGDAKENVSHVQAETGTGVDSVGVSMQHRRKKADGFAPSPRAGSSQERE